jgi:hypothetical protein
MRHYHRPRPKPVKEPEPVIEPPKLQLTSEGPVSESEVCASLGVTPKRLRWMVRQVLVFPAMRPRNGIADRIFALSVSDALATLLRH